MYDDRRIVPVCAHNTLLSSPPPLSLTQWPLHYIYPRRSRVPSSFFPFFLSVSNARTRTARTHSVEEIARKCRDAVVWVRASSGGARRRWPETRLTLPRSRCPKCLGGPFADLFPRAPLRALSSSSPVSPPPSSPVFLPAKFRDVPGEEGYRSGRGGPPTPSSHPPSLPSPSVSPCDRRPYSGSFMGTDIRRGNSCVTVLDFERNKVVSAGR